MNNVDDCEICGEPVHSSVEDSMFEYNTGDGLVMLPCSGIVYRCGSCHLAYTGASMERSRTKAVGKFLGY